MISANSYEYHFKIYEREHGYKPCFKLRSKLHLALQVVPSQKIVWNKIFYTTLHHQCLWTLAMDNLVANRLREKYIIYAEVYTLPFHESQMRTSSRNQDVKAVNRIQ